MNINNGTNIIREKLCNDFPNIYIKEIDTTLKKHKNSYIASYYDLEEQISLNKLKLKKIPGKQKYIGPTIYDDIFKSVKQTIECNCCCNNKEIDEFGQCTEGHLICKDCIKTHATNTIYQQVCYKIKCIDCSSSSKCIGEFNENTLTQILDARVVNEYKNLKKIGELKEISVDDINIKICQHCGSGTDIGVDSEQTLLVCMDCFKDTCLKCNQVDHPGKVCFYTGNVVQGKRQEIEDKMTEALIVKCKKCNTSLFKNEGCNKITCVCGTHSCYICKEIIPKSTGYKHFCVESKCKSNCNMCHLWVQDTKNRLLNAVKDEYSDETKTLINRLL